MAYLYRLIAIAGVLFLLSPSAQASFPATQTNSTACTVSPCYKYEVRAQAGTNLFFPTARDACDAFLVRQSAAQPQYQFPFYSITATCNYSIMNGATVLQSVASETIYTSSAPPATPTYSCPSNSTLSGSTCTCDATYTQNGSTCVPPAPVNNCTALAGKIDGYYNGPGSTGPKHLCVTSPGSGDSAQPGCVVTGYALMAVGDRTTGAYTWGADMSFTGAKCLPDPNASADASGGSGTGTPGTSAGTGSGTSCAPGQLPGTVNGVTVCADAGPGDPVKTTSNTGSTETQPDGTTVGTQTTSTTDCTSTTCTTTTTTTTTTTPPGGSPTSQTGSTTGTCSRSTPGCGDQQSDEDRSSFSGTCGAAFACDGDAIMCSVALEQHNRNCALFVNATPESDLYNTEKGKTGSQAQNENVALGTGNFNQSNALGAGAQCIQDRNITVMGRLVVLPFSIVCNTLQHFGTILIFISFLLAYRIVARG